MLIAIITIIALHSLWVSGRLKQSEDKVETLRAALHRHLETGDDFKTVAVLNGRIVGAA